MVRRSKKLRAIEVAVTSIAIWWGIILVLPFNTFGISDSYEAMEALAPESFWGVFMIGMGFSHLLSMTYNLSRLKRFTLLIATGVWIFIASMFAIGNPMNTATGTYAIIGVLTGWLYTKVGEQKYGR